MGAAQKRCSPDHVRVCQETEETRLFSWHQKVETYCSVGVSAFAQCGLGTVENEKNVMKAQKGPREAVTRPHPPQHTPIPTYRHVGCSTFTPKIKALLSSFLLNLCGV